MARDKKFGDCLPLINALNEAGCPHILIGGQAVNFWAEHYGDTESIQTFHPFTSKDIDSIPVQAGDIRRLKFPKNYRFHPAESPLDGQIAIIESGDIRMDILSDAYGLGRDRVSVVRRAQPAQIEGVDLQIMDPILLLKAKLIALEGLNQDGRQDEKHVRMMLIVLREHLASLVHLLAREELSGRDLIKETKFALTIEKNVQAKKALDGLNESILRNLPSAEFDEIDDPQFNKFWTTLTTPA